jgi:hypothetical protein
MPGMMLSEFAIEILETPQRVTIISESSPLVRSVYLNRNKPTEGLEPMWNGYSLGHWEGQTLVIKTSNFNDRPFPLGFGGAIHAPTTTLTERLSLTDGGKTMVDEMTMEDARYLTRPSRWSGISRASPPMPNYGNMPAKSTRRVGQSVSLATRMPPIPPRPPKPKSDIGIHFQGQRYEKDFRPSGPGLRHVYRPGAGPSRLQHV